MLRRVVAIIVGAAAGYLLYSAAVFGILQPIQQASGRSPEAYLGEAFLLLMPLSLFIGGLLSGYIIGVGVAPGLRTALLHSPGLYVFLAGLPFLRGTMRELQMFMAVAGVVWVAPSAGGVRVGIGLRRRSAPAA